MEPTRWQAWGRHLAAGLGAAVISLFAFILREPVPVFDWVDLGVHELGHMLVMAGPRMFHFLAGSVAQVAVPTALAVYFLWKQKDLAGAGFCLAWAGTSMWDVSVYIADAPIQALPLIGGGTHDWGYLLGPQGWDALSQAGSIAGFVDFLGMAMAGLGMGGALWPAVRHATRRSTPVQVAVTPIERVVREPVNADGPDPIDATPAAAFPSPPSLAPDEDRGPDPWLAASQLPFFHESDEDPARQA
jgi:hypothetical protein